MIMCRIMASRILALLVWAAVAASLAFWGLRWMARPTAVPPGTSSVALSGAAPRGDVTRLLSPPAQAGDEPAAPSQQAMLASRLQLIGVVAPRHEGGQGIALLAVDGKPARAYKTGHVVDGDLVVQSVTQQGVQIGPSGKPAAVNLNLPLMPPPATGMLPSAGGMGGAGTPPTATPPGAARHGGIAPRSAMPQGGGMADTPIEGAEPPSAGPTGAGTTPEDQGAAAPQASPAATTAARVAHRWRQRRGGAQAISGPADDTAM